MSVIADATLLIYHSERYMSWYSMFAFRLMIVAWILKEGAVRLYIATVLDKLQFVDSFAIKKPVLRGRTHKARRFVASWNDCWRRIRLVKNVDSRSHLSMVMMMITDKLPCSWYLYDEITGGTDPAHIVMGEGPLTGLKNTFHPSQRRAGTPLNNSRWTQCGQHSLAEGVHHLLTWI